MSWSGSRGGGSHGDDPGGGGADDGRGGGHTDTPNHTAARVRSLATST